jgi:hypothetical protein
MLLDYLVKEILGYSKQLREYLNQRGITAQLSVCPLLFVSLCRIVFMVTHLGCEVATDTALTPTAH